MNPQADSSIPEPRTLNPARTGRPRKLDEIKRGEICALVSAGCPIRQAAHYVRCSPSTINREAQRDAEFHQRLRRAEMYAQLSPLRAMQQAVATHWRAAAWMLERTHPEHFARRDPRAFGQKDARRLAGDLVEIIEGEVHDIALRQRLVKRVRAAVEYAIRQAWDTQRTNKNLKRAMTYFNEKDRQPADYLDQFGFPAADLDSLLPPFPPRSPANRPAAPGTPDSQPANPSAGEADGAEASDAELTQICGELLQKFAAITASADSQPTQNR